MLRELLSDVLYRVRTLVRGGTAERELDDELRFHIEREADEWERRGLPRTEALRRARLAFGGLEPMKDATRDAHGTAFVESLLQDVRYAARMLRKEPAFTLTVVLMLGLGIGANVSTFTVLNALLLRQLPVPHADRLVIVGDPDSVGSNWHGSPETQYVSYGVYQDVRDRNHVLSGLYASGNLDTPDVVIGNAGGAIEHPGLRAVTGNFFDVLQVPASIGRTTAPDDDRDGGQPVIVISNGYWMRRFGGDRSAVGRNVIVNHVPLTIVGVTPPSFAGDVVGQTIDGWVPIAIEPLLQPKNTHLNERRWSWLQMMGRLGPGTSLSQARDELAAIEAESIRSHTTGDDLTQFENDLKTQPINVQSGARGFSRGRQSYGPALSVMMAAVALVVLIVCANVANLTLVRGIARGREMTVRMTLGAGRARLMRQLLTESLLLAACGGLLGLFLAGAGSRLLLTLGGRGMAIPLDVSQDGRMLAFTAGITILAALLFGLAPAARATRVEIATSLRAGGRSLLGTRGRPGRFAAARMLVVVQITLSVVLLVGAGLLLRTMQRLVQADLGFDRDHVVSVRVRSQKSGYEGARSFALMRDLTDRLRAVPSVTGVSAVMHGLFVGGWGSRYVTVPGFTPATLSDADVGYDAVGPDYFRTIGAHMLSGRDFDAHDSESAGKVAIINRSAARAYFRGVDPIGRVIRFREEKADSHVTIVGVVDDIQDRSVREPAGRRLFTAIVQQPAQGVFGLVVRVAGDPSAAVAAIRDALLARDRDLVFELKPVTDLVGDSVAEDRLTTRVTAFFGGVALFLAALGLYGVTAYGTSQRTGEFGLRIALGAQAGSVTRLILGEGATLAALGLTFGIPAALAATSLIRGQLFRVNRIDPPSLVIAVVMLAGMALLASYIPARRAARIAPLDALRSE